MCNKEEIIEGTPHPGNDATKPCECNKLMIAIVDGRSTTLGYKTYKYWYWKCYNCGITDDGGQWCFVPPDYNYLRWLEANSM